MAGPDRETTGMPRWLRLALIAAVVVILLVVIGMLALGGHSIGPPPGGH